MVFGVFGISWVFGNYRDINAGLAWGVMAFMVFVVLLVF